MQTISKDTIYSAVRDAIPRLACELPQDVADALRAARDDERSPFASCVLDQLVANERIAHVDHVPICQDTGTVWVCLEIGSDVSIAGDVFSRVDEAVAQAYEAAHLRMSVVCDALLDRANTQTNTPAFTEIKMVDEPGVARLHIMLKGGGSDNASRVTMLVPGAGWPGIIAEVLDCVRVKGANACPPLIIGIGIGATFDKVAGLAKHALMRPVGEPSPDEEIAEIERGLLELVNASGVGAGGLGGAHTALAVHIETAPCHIAALPLAINMGCSALRRCTIDLLAKEAAPVDESDDDEMDVVDASIASIEAMELPELEGRRIELPVSREELATLEAGDVCLLTGDIYTLRDAGHMRLLAELEEWERLPYGLSGQVIFYAGPTPEACGRPFGAIGPTTAGRMDFATPALLRAGVVATIGKGKRSEAVRAACIETGSVYFAAVGGAAAFLAKCVDSSETLGYDDLGTEALRRIHVTDFPVFVALDTRGNDIYSV
ncbi:MAG: fumarate hydratase [Eggerthellaceae bacterium]|nr:fumarate hydratase [Eggerthellaceae bacterium]